MKKYVRVAKNYPMHIYDTFNLSVMWSLNREFEEVLEKIDPQIIRIDSNLIKIPKQQSFLN